MTCGINNLEIDRSLFLALMKSSVVDWAQSTSELTSYSESIFHADFN